MVWTNKGISHRSTVMGMRGMVATAHPLASLVGVNVLQSGGNAFDAAVAISATLNVVEPYMSGLGGGGAALIHTADGETTTLNYGGSVPAQAGPSTLDDNTVDIGSRASTVPGAPLGWFTILERFGTMDAGTLFQPAIDHAERGVALTVKNSLFYASGVDRLSNNGRPIFAPGGSAPAAGTVIRQPALAATYRLLAEHGPGVLYDGALGTRMIDAVQAADGLMTAGDLRSFDVEWLEPARGTYRGLQVRSTGWPLTSYEVLMNLNLMEGFDLGAMGHNSADTIHTVAEAMKLSMTERCRYGGSANPPPPGLLSKGYASERRTLIDPERAAVAASERGVRLFPDGTIQPGSPADFNRECTTHFSVVDEDGNAIAITQSLGAAFGSGFLAGDTGIMMNNFLFFFDLDPESPNVIGPDTRWGGPLVPCMFFDDERLFLVIGTPGGFGIPHTTTQMISNVIDHGMGVQAAIEAPRFRLWEGTRIVIEERVPGEVRAELERRGHHVELVEAFSAAVGGGQGILIDPNTGALSGGGDPRRDGTALGY